MIRVDQGSEFISRDLNLWAYQRLVTLDFSRPGRPTDNAFIESFNGQLRAECLNAHWFSGSIGIVASPGAPIHLCQDDAREKCEAWRRDLRSSRSAIERDAPTEAHNAALAAIDCNVARLLG